MRVLLCNKPGLSSRESVKMLPVLFETYHILRSCGIEASTHERPWDECVQLSYEQCVEICDYFPIAGRVWLEHHLRGLASAASRRVMVNFEPSSIAEMCGNPEALDLVQQWFASWQQHKQPLLLQGPPGVGKTSSVQLLCKRYGYTMIEYNASDARSKQVMEDLHRTITQNMTSDVLPTLFPKRTLQRKFLVFLDEFDGLDVAGAGELLELIKVSGAGHAKENQSVPIVMACNVLDTSKAKFREIAKLSACIQFSQIKPALVRDYLSGCFARNDIECPSAQVLESVSLRGDMRYAIRHLQLGAWQQDDSPASTIVHSTDTLESVARRALCDARQLSVQDRLAAYAVDKFMMPLYAFDNKTSLAHNASLEEMAEVAAAHSAYDVLEGFRREAPDVRLKDAVLDETCGLFAMSVASHKGKLRVPQFANGVLQRHSQASRNASSLQSLKSALGSISLEHATWIYRMALLEMDRVITCKDPEEEKRTKKRLFCRVLFYLSHLDRPLEQSFAELSNYVVAARGSSSSSHTKQTLEYLKRFSDVYLKSTTPYDLRSLFINDPTLESFLRELLERSGAQAFSDLLRERMTLKPKKINKRRKVYTSLF